MSATVNRLRVGNEDFLVTAMIERCPKTMMVRELLKNALEAADSAEPGTRRVEFSALPVDGVPKLAIWNTGRGLNGQELRRMCNIATSIRKESGLDRNFGMGAKVASLPSNQHGMRYRSCKEGAVREVVIGKVDGLYGRLLRPGPDGEPTEVLEVTEAARAEGRDTGQDWTEVVLLGNSSGQNTVEDPYAGQPRSGPQWLPETVRGRFLRLPAGTDVVFRAGVARLPRDRSITTVGAHLAGLANYEAVPGPDGMVIHYAHDPALLEGGSVGPWASPPSLAALVHRDEAYGVLQGRDWLREAPAFGVPFLSRAVSVVVELPDAYPVLPDAYREILRYRAGRQDRAVLHDFASIVQAHRPAWLVRMLTEAMPQPDYADEVMNRMEELLNEMRVPMRRGGRRPALEKPEKPVKAPPPGGAAPGAADGGAPPPRPVTLEKAPALILLRDPQEIADRGLTHRAAVYYPETHALHVNLTYGAVEEAMIRLSSVAPEGRDPEVLEVKARLAGERAMVMRIARVLAYALAKRGRPKEWGEAHLRTAFSSEMLTLAADDVGAEQATIEAGFLKAAAELPVVPAAD